MVWGIMMDYNSEPLPPIKINLKPQWYYKLILSGLLFAFIAGGSAFVYHATTRDPYFHMSQERVFAAKELPVYAKKKDKSTQIGTLKVADIATVAGRNSKETGTGTRKPVGAERRGNKTVYIKKDASFWYKINFDGMEGWVHADLADPTATWAELRKLDTLHGPEIYVRYLVEAHGASEDFWIDALSLRDKILRKKAVDVLREMKSKKAIAPLAALLEDDKNDTLDFAGIYNALGHIGGGEAIDALENFYRRHNGNVPLAEHDVVTTIHTALAYAVRGDAEWRYVYDFLQEEADIYRRRGSEIEFWRSPRGRDVAEALQILDRCLRKGYQCNK